jgi:2-keto-myo-inositol isomerase
MTSPISRRTLLSSTAAIAATTPLAVADTNPTATKSGGGSALEPFGYCLNTSTVRRFENQTWGKSRDIVELIAIASKAGYTAIEPWVSELEAYLQTGGTAKELGKRFRDAGLAVPDVIGFAEWLVDDPDRRKKGLDTAKRTMDLIAQVGGERMAAPPVGATGGQSRRDDPNFSQPVTDLLTAAERYRALLDLGRSFGVTPIVEVWGFSKSLSRLGETLMVAAECGLPGGCVLPDVYHLYKGGSEFSGLGVLGPHSIGIFHVNDYPEIPRSTIIDADRVFPGDGIAPLKNVYRTLRDIGYRGYLSLELFNREYWQRDPHRVAREGLEKLRAGVRSALQ